jgi:hypothetical protein
MKSDFLVSCLVGMEKTALFMMEYKDVDMSWIDQFTDFSIRAVEHGIDKYKKSKTGKLIIVSLYVDDEMVAFHKDDISLRLLSAVSVLQFGKFYLLSRLFLDGDLP